MNEATMLSALASQAFWESHGNSATTEDIRSYINEAYNVEVLRNELSDEANLYYCIFVNSVPAGYSKIVLNSQYPDSQAKNISRLDRLYLLREFYDQNLGSELFEFNLNLVRQNNQSGIWLYAWTENERALGFYRKHGFKIIGSHNFRISETHSNPNHQMLLSFW